MVTKVYSFLCASADFLVDMPKMQWNEWLTSLSFRQTKTSGPLRSLSCQPNATIPPDWT